MKSQLIALLLAMSATSLPVITQADGSGQGYRQDGMGEGRLDQMGVQLTDTQKSQLAQLQNQKKQSRDAVYTPEQRQKIQNARSIRQSLNLSAAQKSQLQAIHQAVGEKLMS
jgi:Spy/CpxP family protein refolding chaperone